VNVFSLGIYAPFFLLAIFPQRIKLLLAGCRAVRLSVFHLNWLSFEKEDAGGHGVEAKEIPLVRNCCV
jgi:hypothetical protein